jgi:hypothetical protein
MFKKVATELGVPANDYTRQRNAALKAFATRVAIYGAAAAVVTAAIKYDSDTDDQ